MSAPFILHGARVHTLGASGTAEALAIRGGRIVAAGTLADCWAAVGSDAPSTDLGGRTVLPGLTDAHLHWPSYALLRRRLRIDGSQDLASVLAAVGEAAGRAPRGTWIVGRGWDHSRWGRWPDRADLDAAAPDHPVFLTRKDGHAAWLNSAALALAGLADATPAPPGGALERAAGGGLTGIILENAIALAWGAVPQPTDGERRAAIKDAWADAWQVGLTGCHEMGFAGFAFHDDLIALRAAGSLGLRFVWYGLHETLDEMIARGWQSGDGDAWLRIGGLKLFLDGTLGSQTADMLAPYEGQPLNRGLATLEFEAYCDLVSRAAAAGLATAVHAIGDAANRKALDGFAQVRRDQPATAALRPRIEHCQIVDPADVSRFARIGVVASMQPIHATADMREADRYWGDRAAHAYAWRTLLDSGAGLAFGSDAPIESLDPWSGLHAAVKRQDASGSPAGGWRPDQRISLGHALGAYTSGAAWAGGAEDDTGRLGPGCCADLIVLDRDPFERPPEELLELQVRATMIDGHWVWHAADVGLAPPPAAW